MAEQQFSSFREFYPYYLSEHADRRCRLMHYVGTWLVIAVLALGVLVSPWWLLAVPVVGYGFAWVGHFAFEHNRPATFTHPLWSLAGDWRMWWEITTGKVRI